MSNSPLVSYTKLSPNHSGQRTHSIDRITPHCVVGQCSVERLGEIFAPASRQASSNYGIGSDGRVGMYCEEKNRSWCSSSNANDQRAVTIECASDTTEPYAFREVVFDKLVELCADICKRNGKTKLLWLGSKEKALNYVPKPDEMILTAHRWFASTCCPGTWMYAREGLLAERVNKLLDDKPDLIVNGVDYSFVYDYEYYMAKYEDLREVFKGNQRGAFNHFLNFGMKENRQAKADFNVDIYAYNYPDLQKAYGVNIPRYYEHFCKFGIKEHRIADKYIRPISVYKGVDYSLVYNGDHYNNRYKDLRDAYNGDYGRLIEHFVKFGMVEGRQASNEFNVHIYQSNYKDLRDAFGDELPKYYMHYIKFGYSEGRDARNNIRR